MDIFDNRFYKMNKKLLYIVGQWPYQASWLKLINGCVMNSLAISYLIPQVIKIMQSLNETTLLMKSIPLVATNVICCAKYASCVLNNKKLKVLLECVKQEWQEVMDEKEREILEMYAERTRKVTRSYAVYLLTIAGLFCAGPVAPVILDWIAPLNESRPLELLNQAEYFIDVDKHFYPLQIHATFGCMAGAVMLVAVDTLYMAYIEHACGLFIKVSYQLKIAAGEEMREIDINPSKDNDEGYRRICKCLQTHKKAIQFADLMEDTYTTYYLILITICMTLISINGVYTVSVMDQPAEFITHGTFMLGHFLHLFAISLPGQKLIDHSLVIGDSVSEVPWYRMSIRARRLLIVLLLRSARPSVISAGKLYYMCLESFSKVVQTSMSYFTVLSSLY